MTADRGGVYVVHHYQHRRSHQVMVPAGTVFPKCRMCGDKVQFAPIVAAETWDKDIDFADRELKRRRTSGAA